MSGGRGSSQVVPFSQSRWKIILTTIVTYEIRPRGSKIFAESDNTARLVSCDSGTDKLAHKNWKWSEAELYSIARVLTKLSEFPRLDVVFVLQISGEIEFKTSCEFESHLWSLNPPLLKCI